jgi:hypothetical protein
MTLRPWSKLRLLVASLATVTAALLASGFWVVGQAQYLNDYCTTDRVQQPTPTNLEALGGRPAYLDGPVTVVCEYDGYPTVTVTDPAPLLGALVVMSLVVAFAAVTLRWARRGGDTPTSRPSRLLSR